ncbi:MAG: bifunctional folylpolyglutamate synthase/dihydrofolate synthase [Alloprevotella sp.]
MTYAETLDYLYHAAPLFQQVGGAAYKEGLTTTRQLDTHFGHPHTKFRNLHIAGTNGKGSCAHTLAAILQAAGVRTGLYTSPHLVDFRERIRVDGVPIPEEYVVRFVEEERSFFEPLHPSFFELTTALAFKYFAEAGVEVAVVETGLGGRLDCTNIIRPEVTAVTNISLDHTQFLGDTVAKIAAEKAGIFKPGVPAVVGEALPDTQTVFSARAAAIGAPLVFAEELPEVTEAVLVDDSAEIRAAYAAIGHPQADTATLPPTLWRYTTRSFGTFYAELSGDCQPRNTNTVLCTLKQLPQLPVTPESIRRGFLEVCRTTGLQGRWQTVGRKPTVVCDTGHNLGGWTYLASRLTEIAGRSGLHVVFGMAGDKDIDGVLALLPQQATYYFAKASVHRALDATTIAGKARTFGLRGLSYPTVEAAYAAARAAAAETDFIYVGGSSFVVADFLTALGRELPS